MNGRARLLDRPRPEIYVAQLGVAAVEGKRLALGPCAQNQFVGFAVFLARERGDLAVAKIRVHRGAHRKSSHKTSAGNAVQHGEFLGDAQRWIVERDGCAKHHDGNVTRAPGKTRGDQVRGRHQAVRVLMMLVHADAIEPERPGVFEQINVRVVERVALLGIEQPRIDIHPDRAMLLAEIGRQVGPRHQVKPGEFHDIPLNRSGYASTGPPFGGTGTQPRRGRSLPRETPASDRPTLKRVGGGGPSGVYREALGWCGDLAKTIS